MGCRNPLYEELLLRKTVLAAEDSPSTNSLAYNIAMLSDVSLMASGRAPAPERELLPLLEQELNRYPKPFNNTPHSCQVDPTWHSFYLDCTMRMLNIGSAIIPRFEAGRRESFPPCT